jgi:hypothetical protein
VLAARRLAVHPAGEAGGAKVMTTWQVTRETGGLVERVVADAALEEGDVNSNRGRRGRGTLALGRHVSAVSEAAWSSSA